jgi:hypothetical protein
VKQDLRDFEENVERLRRNTTLAAAIADAGRRRAAFLFEREARMSYMADVLGAFSAGYGVQVQEITGIQPCENEYEAKIRVSLPEASCGGGDGQAEKVVVDLLSRNFSTMPASSFPLTLERTTNHACYTYDPKPNRFRIVSALEDAEDAPLGGGERVVVEFIEEFTALMQRIACRAAHSNRRHSVWDRPFTVCVLYPHLAGGSAQLQAVSRWIRSADAEAAPSVRRAAIFTTKSVASGALPLLPDVTFEGLASAGLPPFAAFYDDAKRLQPALPFYLRVDRLGKGFVRNPNSSARVPMIDVGASASYRYVLDYPSPGVSRFKYLALLGSVVLRVMPGDNVAGTEYWEPLFIPWVHYAPVASNLHDLHSVLLRLRSDSRLSESIARNCTALAQRVFSPGAVEEIGVLAIEKYVDVELRRRKER